MRCSIYVFFVDLESQTQEYGDFTKIEESLMSVYAHVNSRTSRMTHCGLIYEEFLKSLAWNCWVGENRGEG